MVHKVFIILITLIIGPLTSAQVQVIEKPAPAPTHWEGYYGEYTFEDEKILFRENLGHFEALFNPPADGINIKNLEIRNLIQTSTSTFTSNSVSFSFKVNESGMAVVVMMDDKAYLRKFIEPGNGATFKVDLDKSIEEYTKIALNADPPQQLGEFVKSDLVDVTTVLENVKLDIRYATKNNFLNVATYSLPKSFLQRPALMALNRANKRLNSMGFGILIHDTYRPWYVTKIFWDATEGAERNFVADPKSGSKHNMGSAVDLTLYDLSTGSVIKMVGTYDEMSDRSYPHYLGGTTLERWHRNLLRTIVEAEGFRVLYNEWWHFDHEDWQKYPILNDKFEDLIGYE
tara:strand:- start:3489 stop:4520 length:1032 start_codon:yes stop_codon:yes gene_type:complete